MDITWGDSYFTWGDPALTWSLDEIVTIGVVASRSGGNQVIATSANPDLISLLPVVAADPYFSDLPNNVEQIAMTWKHSSGANKTATWQNDGNGNFYQENFITFSIHSHVGDWALVSIVLTDYDSIEFVIAGADLPTHSTITLPA